MPKLKQKYKQPLREINRTPNVLQTNKVGLQAPTNTAIANEPSNEYLGKVSSLLDDENRQPGTSSGEASASTSALYNELHSFRQRWRRELESTTGKSQPVPTTIAKGERKAADTVIESDKSEESKLCDRTVDKATKSDQGQENELEEENSSQTADSTYTEAKRLFLIAVDMERDDMHHESIQYYKKSMHLCPDIEKRIFKEQCEASVKNSAANQHAVPEQQESSSLPPTTEPQSEISLYESILENYRTDAANQSYSHCRPHHKVKAGALHISDLPHELMFKILRHVIGDELDLASLEQAGMVCRGFYLMSKEKLLWRDICFSTWGASTSSVALKRGSDIDWRHMFLERARVNFDGIYISRTRYFRQGDVGFQDITYRPFHVVRYYRYLRFFPNRRVLILTTNEEPEKIVPIFRHALSAKQFSPELSIMEGSYEYTASNQICIRAEKKCRLPPPSGQNHRRQAQFNWSRQTPITQNFNLKFELKTAESKPYRNNVLRWLDYTIVSRLETGQEVTNFDISPDTFPNLIFSRVKRFNLRSANPLFSH